MNKNMALTIVGVILLGMALVAYNEYTAEPSMTETAAQSEQAKAEQSPNTNPEPSPESSSAAAPTPEQNTATDTNRTSALSVPQAPADPEEWSSNAPLAPAAPSPVESEPAKPEVAAPATAPEPAAAPPTTEPSAVPSTEAAQPSTAEKPKLEPAEAPKKIETPKLEPAEAPKKVETPKKEEPKAPKAEVATEKKPEPKEPAEKIIKKISILSIGDGVTVRLDSNQLPAYKAMQLKSPARIVLDLTGDWKVKAPGIPKNEFVTNVRIGEQKDGTRIVIDLSKTPASVRYLKYAESGLDVRIR